MSDFFGKGRTKKSKCFQEQSMKMQMQMKPECFPQMCCIALIETRQKTHCFFFLFWVSHKKMIMRPHHARHTQKCENFFRWSGLEPSNGHSYFLFLPRDASDQNNQQNDDPSLFISLFFVTILHQCLLLLLLLLCSCRHCLGYPPH